FMTEANKAWTVDRWMTPQGPLQFKLKPGKSRMIPVHVVCPKEIVGEVMGMVSFSYRVKNQGMVTPMISVSIYVMANASEKIDGEIKGLVVSKYQNQWIVTATVKSTGNVHIRPTGTLAVTDTGGVPLGSAAVPQGAPTYPGMEYTYSGPMPAAMQLSSG